jgi:hypothetical protein
LGRKSIFTARGCDIKTLTSHGLTNRAGHLDEELELRVAEAETTGAGFEVPIAPNAPRNCEELELELELQDR